MAVPAKVLVLVEDVRVDGSCDHDGQSGQELEESREGEPLALGEGEELGYEHQDGNDGKDTGEYRAGLHRLEVPLGVGVVDGQGGGVPFTVDLDPASPDISGNVVCHPPGIVNGGDQQHDDADDVEKKDARQYNHGDCCKAVGGGGGGRCL